MPKSAARSTIAVDVDDVLARFAESFVGFSNKRWGTRLTVDDYTEHWMELWSVDHEELNNRVKVIYESDVFTASQSNDKALEVLQKLAKDHDLVVITSRQREASKDTIDWIHKHFGPIFKEVHFAGIWDDLDKDFSKRIKLNKAELCKQIGADYLIDDQPKHCIAAANVGIKALLFGDYTWNRDTKLVKGMTRVKDWRAIDQYFYDK